MVVPSTCVIYDMDNFFVGSIVAIEQDESLREDATKRVIRLMWIPLMDTVGHNVTVLAGHLCQERRITPREETYIVTSKRNPRDKAVELLQTVERKGWQCLVELVNGMKLLVPLHDLTRRMLTAMEQCGKFHLLLIVGRHSITILHFWIKTTKFEQMSTSI